MRPEIQVGLAVTALFGALAVAAGWLPWAPFMRGAGHRVVRTVVSLAAVLGIFTAWTWTWADVQVAYQFGDGMALCGGSILFMLHTAPEYVEGLSHDCVVRSRVGVGLLLAAAIAVLLLECWVLRKVSARRRARAVSSEATDHPGSGL
ncbi:hypothetical protein [Actinomyces wuliandei]|uniref:hypothetical protein n=1 Tax=Actinomyces wuliandei TaxID=2057743 RepID=UPI000FD7D63F|nr:hypothetical protein [Actinomyces wuliandei]